MANQDTAGTSVQIKIAICPSQQWEQQKGKGASKDS